MGISGSPTQDILLVNTGQYWTNLGEIYYYLHSWQLATTVAGHSGQVGHQGHRSQPPQTPWSEAPVVVQTYTLFVLKLLISSPKAYCSVFKQYWLSGVYYFSLVSRSYRISMENLRIIRVEPKKPSACEYRNSSWGVYPQGAAPPFLYAREGRQKSFERGNYPPPPTRIGKRFSQTISNLALALMLNELGGPSN